MGCVCAGSPVANMPIAVMDFATHQGATTADLDLMNAEKTTCEYVTERLVDCGKVSVVDKDLVQQVIQELNLNVVGIVDPDTAKQLGELLHVKYIVYGNVMDVTASDTGTGLGKNISAGLTVSTVKSHVMARIMDVDTGDILTMAKGEGVSKSTYVKAGSEPLGTISIGKSTVTQDSVHNALQKASYQAVDIMVKRLAL